MRKDYGEDGTVTHHQILIPKHMVPELLSTLHDKMNKHPGITRMIQECQTKYYYSGLARRIRAWVINWPDCIATKRIDTRKIRPKLLCNTEITFGPDDCLEVDILPNLPSSNGYKHILTSELRKHGQIAFYLHLHLAGQCPFSELSFRHPVL